uniref:Galectin n=1 Tax=Phlebotomus papatasi TaxID=29031 RepID=Q5SEX6_PHLPP|nr:midgut specific galectin [Phlebotomus papatasi]
MTTSFSGQLACPVEFGHAFFVCGKSTGTADRVVFNLATGKNLGDIPLHISARFRANVVVRNNRVGQCYGAEETSPGYNNVKNPLVAGQEFKIYVLVGVDRFHISLNDVPFTEFMFRAPYRSIAVLQVLQDVEYIRQVDHRKVYPSPYPAVQVRSPWYSFSNDLPTIYNFGHVVVVTGIALGNPKGHFVIRFLEGHSEKQGLHFNVRFYSREVARNHTVNSKMEFNYNDEDKYGGFPFELNRPFKIAFGFGERGFRIAVNGSYFCEYGYRGRWNNFTGIKCSEHDGLTLSITEVDHVMKDKTLTNFEQLSRI